MSASPTELFAQPREYDSALLEKFEQMEDPRVSYIIAMTPRSGSSYLCDVLKKTHLLGKPDERLNAGFLPNILKKIPGPTPETYVRNLLRFSRSRNGIAGIKVSWFQFAGFTAAMNEPELLEKCRYVYLYRRDSAQQAVSLYLATESNVFHTNVEHSGDELQRLERLEYDFDKIGQWHEHILRQERGWKAYFDTRGINPLAITYEDIVDDLPCVLRRLARHVNVKAKSLAVPPEQSVFRKIGDTRNFDWAQRYVAEKHARELAAAGQ